MVRLPGIQVQAHRRPFAADAGDERALRGFLHAGLLRWFPGALSLLEGKGFRGAKARLARDFNSLSAKSIKVWGVANIPLFLFVPLHMRVVVSMGMHYVYLVGLALWDANARKQAQAPEQETAWGSEQPRFTQPALNLAYAKMPLVDVPP